MADCTGVKQTIIITGSIHNVQSQLIFQVLKCENIGKRQIFFKTLDIT